MQLVALVEAPDHVCCRYRFSAFRPHLEKAGHQLLLQPLPRSWWSRWALFRRLRGASVVLQRQLLPGWQVSLLRQYVRHLLFDFDDAIWLRDSYSPRGLHHPRKLRRFAATIRACDFVIAGNGFLADQARKFTEAERVHVIPTCVDPERYSPLVQKPTSGKQLVWIGSSSTLQGLEQIRPMLEEIGKSVPGTTLKVICDRFPRFEHLPVIACPWNAATEARELASADVGISWIPDDLWSRGKCGLKVLQYMAAGLPVVANPVGVHPEMILPGETGYLASTVEQWRQAVLDLTSDESRRRRMGQQGRCRFESCYAVAAGARSWLELLSRLSAQAASVA